MQHAKSVRGVKLILMGPPLPEKWPEQCRTLICSRLMRFDRYFWKGEPKMKKIISAVLTLIMSFSVFAFAQTTEAATMQSQAGVVSTSSGRLNIRSQASTGSAVVASLDKGSYVTLLSKSGSWWYVEYADGKYGYCHADYIKTVSGNAAAVHTQSGNLNVRSGAGTSYAVVDRLAKGEIVVVLSSSGSWSRVLFDGTETGYVSSQYLRQQQTYPGLSLNLPNFKQTDSRWANVTIGSSGKTIAQIGCTTTAIAMMESYRSGQTIYPDAISKKLNYSSSGDLYWPSDYQVVTSYSLSAIYKQLEQGKPVLFGAKKSSGKQHWVVINGYKGGDTLSASGFTVLDPGSNSRTTLQHLLNEYPVFYKYFYYK